MDISREDFQKLLDACEAERQIRASVMPTEDEALRIMFSAWLRLKELGWKEIMYCPKDGTIFQSISVGSTGIHPCHYEGEWPKGSWWVHEANDLWPADPCLFKKLTPDGHLTERGFLKFF